MKDIVKNKLKDRKTAHEALIEPLDKPVRQRKVKFEETHTRQTYYIENDLLNEFNQLAGNEKGEKTRIINEALRDYLKKLR